MNVHAEHVSKTVRHEEPVGTIHQSFFGVAFHQADAFKTFNQGAAGQSVHHHVRHVGTRLFRHGLVGGEHDFINLALAGVELATHRRGAGEVGGIVVLRFGTGITHHHAAFFQHVVVTVVVQGLTVDAQNDRERHGAATRKREAFHHAGNLLLHHAGFTHLHCSGVHVVSGVGGAFHLGDFEFALHLTHGDDGLDEFEADKVLHLINIAIQPFGALNLSVGAISRQDMDLATFGDGLLDVLAKAVEVAAVGDADAVALFLQ